MSPIKIKSGPAGGETYATPFVGPNNHPAPIRVDPSIFFGTAWLDARGYLKPGTPLAENGTLPAAAGPAVHGCLFEATKIVDPAGAAPTQAELDAIDPLDVIVATICQVNRDQLEDIAGRALNADEIAAFAASKAVVVI